jgi:hypothetical protein
MTPLTPEQVAKDMRMLRRLWTDGYIDKPERNKLELLGASHEALRAETDSLRAAASIAERHADGWHPQFHTDPAKSQWVPWNEGEPEQMTPPEVEWYRRRREARR